MRGTNQCAPLIQLHRILLYRGDFLDQLVVEQELFVGLIARLIQFGRIAGKQRQAGLPGLFVQRGIQFRMGLGERQPAFLRMGLQVVIAFFQRREEFFDFRLAYRRRDWRR